MFTTRSIYIETVNGKAICTGEIVIYASKTGVLTRNFTPRNFIFACVAYYGIIGADFLQSMICFLIYNSVVYLTSCCSSPLADLLTESLLTIFIRIHLIAINTRTYDFIAVNQPPSPPAAKNDDLLRSPGLSSCYHHLHHSL